MTKVTDAWRDVPAQIYENLPSFLLAIATECILYTVRVNDLDGPYSYLS